MERRERGIEEIIRAAMEEGAFDHLPGKGQPLNLEDNPYLDREWQLAYHLLKENGYAPDFIERRQAIEQELATAREQLARSWAWRGEALGRGEAPEWVEERWAAARARFKEQMDAINKQIRDYNLTVPKEILARKLIDITSELDNFDRNRTSYNDL